jgi:hypothetical protein
LNEFGEGPRFYHITVGAARIAASEVVLVVGGGEDDDGDRGEAGIGSEPLQEVAAVLAAEVQVQQNEGRRGNRYGLCARGTRGRRLPSFDARSGDHTGHLTRRASEGIMGVVRPVLKKVERCIRVMLRIEGDIEASLHQRQAKEFALAGAVFDQEDGGVRHHIEGISAGIVPGSKMKSERMEW